MTHPTEPRVEVTQADREAAADACFFDRSPDTEREPREGFFDKGGE